MRYAIKSNEIGYSYVDYVATDRSFTYERNIDRAKQFDSIHEAIEAIVQRSLASPHWINNFTIVGIKDLSTPRYEEVIL